MNPNHAVLDLAALFGALSAHRDPHIRRVRHTRINDIPARVESWCSDGIYGETTVFRRIDVQAFSDAELIEMATQNADDRRMATVMRNESFVRVNHSFRL